MNEFFNKSRSFDIFLIVLTTITKPDYIMGHHELRDDKECQNCGHTVELAYCSKCGQQNIDTRQPFTHLVKHIFEDITHYDGNFWKTIKYLLFRPGKLTNEYLIGHRMRYVPPVRLYIFISFVTFFLMAVMAPEAEEEHIEPHAEVNNVNVKVKGTESEIEFGDHTYHGVRDFDSIQNSLPENQKLPVIGYYTVKALVKASENKITMRDFIITTAHTLPKVLFVYMPLFAFWLWLFHGKKRWMLFDHGIYTLHYFSFLLLLITINLLIGCALSYVPINNITDFIANTVSIFSIICMIYSFFYFFRSHRKVYGETRAISRLKSLALFFVNFICIMITLIFTLIYIVLHIH